MGLFNQTNLSASLGNTGLQNFPGGRGKWKRVVGVPKGDAFATKVLALTKTEWTAKLYEEISKRWFVFPLIWNGEPNQEEAQRETSDFGYTSFVRDGKLMYMIQFEELHIHNKNELNKLNDASLDFFVITDKNIIEAHTDGTMVIPFSVDYHRILPETQNTGSTNARVSMEIAFSEVSEMNLKQIALQPLTDPDSPTVWYPAIELPAAAVKDLVVEITAMTDTTTKFTLKGYDGVVYSGAVAGDVYLRKSTLTGSLITISELTFASGEYTATHAAQTSGTFYLSLKPVNTATTKGVETPVVDSFVAVISS
jgi:hypothetical protein